jgi:hypothetical protein
MTSKAVIHFLLLIWQFPQSIGAVILRCYLSGKGCFPRRYVYRGRTVYHWNGSPRFAVSLGEYIFTYHLGDQTLAHEYGHSRQSRRLGPLYLLTVGVASVFWDLLNSIGQTKERQNEQLKILNESLENSEEELTISKQALAGLQVISGTQGEYLRSLQSQLVQRELISGAQLCYSKRLKARSTVLTVSLAVGIPAALGAWAGWKLAGK